MDRSSHVSGVSTFDRILWDEPPAIACAYPTRNGSGVVLHARSPQSGSADIPKSADLVMLVMRDALHRYDEASVRGLPVDRGFARGRFTLIPPGCASRWASGGHPALLHIQLTPDRLAPLDELAVGPLTYGLRVNAHDPAIDRIALQLASELAAPGPFTELAVDTLLLGLALHVARHYSNGKTLQSGDATRLAPWRIARVLDCIDGRLADALSLDHLARTAGLSTGHFARCFKSTFGVSAHRYVLERRVDRAKQLLAESRLSIAEIALACGFASQSHLTDCFRAIARTTPATWRRGAASRDVTPKPAQAHALTLSNANRQHQTQWSIQ